MTESLEQVIADERAAAQTLRARGLEREAVLIEQVVTRVAAAAEDWLLWLSEGDATMRTGYSVAFLRARFPAWEREGHARSQHKQRQYRACILPRRANTIDAAAKGREAARDLKQRMSA